MTHSKNKPAVQVYHANKEILRESLSFGLGTDPYFLQAKFIEGKYTLVFDSDDKALTEDDAYAMTQNVDHAWRKPPLEPCRSTSMGDIIFVKGRAHIVALAGFTRLPDLDV